MTALDLESEQLRGYLAALRALQKAPEAVTHLIDSLPETLDLIRRVATEGSVVGLIDLQREAGDLLDRFDGRRTREQSSKRSAPRTLVAGPRAGVYLVTPGARMDGQTGQAAKVFDAIRAAGANGKTSGELREELQLKPKSLESVLYRLRLAGLIRAYDIRDIRSEDPIK